MSNEFNPNKNNSNNYNYYYLFKIIHIVEPHQKIFIQTYAIVMLKVSSFTVALFLATTLFDSIDV